MKINAIRLNKIISVVCAVCIALTTFIYSGVTALASETSDYDTTNINTTATAFDIAAKMSEYVSFGGVALSTDVLATSLNTYMDAKTGGYLLVDDTANVSYYIDTNGELYRAGAGGRSRVGSGSDIEFSGETFSKIVERLNEQYAPKGVDYKIISIHNDKRYSADDSTSSGTLSFFSEGRFCSESLWDEVYIIPFYCDGTDYYFGVMQSHWTQTLETVDSTNYIYMDVEFTSMVDDTVVYTSRVKRNSNDVNFSNYRYIDLSLNLWANGFVMWCYNSYSNYIGRTSGLYSNVLHSGDKSDLFAHDRLYSDDCLNAGTFDNYVVASAVETYPYTDNENYVDGMDMGFLAANKPMSFDVDWTGIDPSLIDPDLTVIPDGDTIYDYTVTNIDGDTTTVNEYVTNNYTIINEGDTIYEGDTIIDIDFGDFLLEIETSIVTAIKTTFNLLFVPSDGFFDNKVDQLKTDLEAKLPVAADLPDIFSELFIEMDEEGNIIRASVDDGSEGDPVVDEDYSVNYYPKWELNFEYFGQEITVTILDFYVYREVLPLFRSLILSFVYVLYIYRFTQYLPTLIGNIGQMASAGVTTSAWIDHYRDQAEVKGDE